ncbi:MAG: NAD(P)H-binding protein [Deltaproteobacteria bacterium]|nr:NAD(P)H-binding protein [Deltaproteobacteria bacterium]
MARVLVTGATGNVGREVVSALLVRGAKVRVAERSADRVRAACGGEVEPVPFDFFEPATFRGAVRGCDALFLMRPPPIQDVKATLNALVDRAREASVASIVFLSVAGAGKNRAVPHHGVEGHLQAGPRDWTILRPGFFAQNFEDAYLRDVRDDDRVYVPAGDGVVTFVDVRDVGEVAAMALTAPEQHREKAYTLTGPEAVSFARAAELLSAALGRMIRYEPASILGYGLHLRRRGLPPLQALVQTILHVGLRFGQAAVVDPTLAQVLGRAPRTLAEYVRDRADVWRRDAATYR